MQSEALLALYNSYLTAAITASATTAYVKSVTSIPTAPFYAILDAGTDKEEVVQVTAVTTTTKALTIVRAQGGTTGVAHGDDTLFHACQVGAVNLDLDFGVGTLTPDATRTHIAFQIGNRVTEKDITMAAAADQNLDPIQVKLNIIGSNPTNSSTLNVSYMDIVHDTGDKSYLRLKCADWNVHVGMDVKDVYVYQGEIDFTTAAVTVGGEAAVLGLVMNAGSYDITGNLRGLIISMQGAGMHDTAIGLEIRTTCGHALGTGLAEGIRISGTPLPIVGIAMGNQTNDNEGPQNAFFFPSIGGADEGPCVASGTAQGAITIKIGATTRYIRFFTTA